jgi:hypothetical protein
MTTEKLRNPNCLNSLTEAEFDRRYDTAGMGPGDSMFPDGRILRHRQVMALATTLQAEAKRNGTIPELWRRGLSYHQIFPFEARLMLTQLWQDDPNAFDAKLVELDRGLGARLRRRNRPRPPRQTFFETLAKRFHAWLKPPSPKVPVNSLRRCRVAKAAPAKRHG